MVSILSYILVLYGVISGKPDSGSAVRSGTAVINTTDYSDWADKSLVPEFFSYHPPTKKPKGQKRWFFIFSPKLNSFLGNNEILSFGGNAGLEYNDSILEVQAEYSAMYSRAQGELVAHIGNVVLRYDNYVFSRWEFFTFSRFTYDVMANLKVRNNTGAGMKFVAFRNRYLLTDISGAPVLQFEKYEQLDRTFDIRFSLRYRTNMFLTKGISLNSAVFYIPAFYNFSDYRIELDASGKIELFTLPTLQSLHLIVSYTLRFNSFAPSGTYKGDHTTTIAIELRI